MASSLSSIYGTKLNPSQSVVTRHAFKEERQVITVSKNSSSIATPSGQIFLIRFPTLGKDRVLEPGTVKLLYDVIHTRGTDVNNRFVNNLGRGIIEQLSIRMQG